MKHLKLFAALCCAAMLFAACDKSNEPSNGANNQNTEKGHEYVDLGLPSGTLWATCNVGASKPEEYGDYYAWGETKTKTNYNSWGTYTWCAGSATTLTKYCNDANYGNNGFTDGKTTLDPEDDAAAVNWGGRWRMPTHDDWNELYTNCTWTWTADYQGTGIAGRVVTGPNGNFIFLPAAGYRFLDNLYLAGGYGYYWSSSLYTGYPDVYAWFVYFGSGSLLRGGYNRYYGQSVRPVLF